MRTRHKIERTSQAAIPADFGWSDVGSWSALWELAEKDAAGNAARGEDDIERFEDRYNRG